MEDPAADPAAAATETDPANDAPLSAADQERIISEEFERITATPTAEDKPAPDKPSDEERPRGPDGKFLPKDGDPAEAVVDDKGEAEKAAAAKAALNPETKPQPSAATVSAELPATGSLFDVDAIISSVTAEINAMEFEDVPAADGSSQKTTGEKALKEYGQIADPIMARQDKMIRAVVEKMTEIIRPALEVARAFQAETAQTAVKSTIDALVADGVSDAAQLIADPRLAEFAKQNPHYAALLVADPNRTDDIKFVMAKFRAAHGIAAPSGEKKTTGAPVQRARPNNALQAAVSSARGGGSARDEGGSITGTPEQIMRAEFDRLERLEKQQGAGGRI